VVMTGFNTKGIFRKFLADGRDPKIASDDFAYGFATIRMPFMHCRKCCGFIVIRTHSWRPGVLALVWPDHDAE